MKVRHSFLLLFLLTCAFLTSAQTDELRFHHIGVEQGLSHSLVSSIAEDSLGFIWFGTQDGLNRFDAYEFRTYYKGKSPRHPSDSWISRLYMDRGNQLWIVYNGSGLERYDPLRETFHAYTPDSLDPASISSNLFDTDFKQVQGLFFEDSRSQLWIGTTQGLNCYDRETDNFRVFLHDPDDPSTLSHDQIICIDEDREGYLWVGTVQGLNRLDPGTGQVRRFPVKAGSRNRLNDSFITSIRCASDGSLWVGMRDGGLNIIELPNSDQPRVTHLVTRPLDPNNLPTIYHIHELSRGLMLVASHHGLYRITAGAGSYKEELIPETKGIQVSLMMTDSKGFTWVASQESDENSLFRLDPGAGRITAIEIGKDDSQMFGGGRVQTLLESRTGLVWIGTEKHGIYQVDLNARNFRIINAQAGRKPQLSDEEVYSIFEDDSGQLYVGTKTALNRLDLSSGEMYHFHNDLHLQRGVIWEYSSLLSAQLVGVMEPDHHGRIWMGAFDYKVSLYEPGRKLFLNFHHHEEDPASFRLWSLRSICVTRDDEVYFGGTGSGLCRLKEDGYSFEYFPVIPGTDSRGTNDGHIQYISEDAEGIIWLGTLTGGLNRFDPGSGSFSHFMHDPGNPATLSDNRVKCILEPQIYNEGILWIGTHNGGLSRFHKESGTFRTFTMAEGLPSNTIHGILEDKKGRLWISTNRGIARFDPLTESISVFTREDGISGNEFNEGAFFQNREGILYFGGTRGITYFDPDEISEKPDFRIPVIFTTFSVSGNPVMAGDTVQGRVILERSVSFTDRIRLTHRDRFISFGFAAPDMAAAGKLRYRYMLVGFDDSWNLLNANQRFISYANLPSGNYQLKVAASNSDGTLFREPAILELLVMPSFWERPLFLVFLGTLILLGFFVVLRARTRMLKKQKIKLAREVEERSEQVRVMADKLHESDQMKLKFFTNISHEIRTPLTLIMGPTEKLLERKEIAAHPEIREELKLMYRNERRLYKLINQLLELRRVETGNLELAVAEGNLVAFLQNIHQLFRPYAEKEQIDFGFNSSSEIMHIYFDPDKMEKILYNLLSNAFKFTPEGGRIALSCEQLSREQQSWVRIAVEDSGYGIPPESLPHVFDRFYQGNEGMPSGENSSGIGLSLTRDLVEKHRGFIELQSTVGKGSRFEVFFPGDPDIYGEGEVRREESPATGLAYISSMLDKPEYGEREKADGEVDGDALPRILIVEDNADLRSFLRRELQQNYLISLAEDGTEGLELAMREGPELIISDVMMPKMDGHTFCRRIKENEKTSHIPLIMLTARTGTEEQLAGLASGADDYIIKPFHADILKQKVKNILLARKQLADRFSRETSYIPEQINISQIDQGFLEKIIKLVEDNLDNTDLSGDVLARELGMSKGNLYKKLKALTGMTVNIFIRTIRLKVAARLLKQGKYNISEVAYAVGFNNPKYFSTCFSEMFSLSPKEYMK